MFALKVVGLVEANSLISEHWPTRIVSLLSDGAVSHGPHHLHIQMSDSLLTQQAFSPQPGHLQRVLRFTDDLNDTDRLLVHCLGGQSRSPAMAIAILIQHGMDYRAAFDHVMTVRAIALPNTLIVQHIDDHFELNNQLVSYVADHRRIELSDIVAHLWSMLRRP